MTFARWAIDFWDHDLKKRVSMTVGIVCHFQRRRDLASWLSSRQSFNNVLHTKFEMQLNGVVCASSARSPPQRFWEWKPDSIPSQIRLIHVGPLMNISCSHWYFARYVKVSEGITAPNSYLISCLIFPLKCVISRLDILLENDGVVIFTPLCSLSKFILNECASIFISNSWIFNRIFSHHSFDICVGTQSATLRAVIVIRSTGAQMGISEVYGWSTRPLSHFKPGHCPNWQCCSKKLNCVARNRWRIDHNNLRSLNEDWEWP